MDIMYTKGNPFNILFVGRIVEEKWIQVLIECIKKTMIHTSFGEMVHWHIVGEGKDFPLLEKVKNRFPEWVTLYGRMDTVQLDELRKIMHLSIVPSIFLETFGLVALESLTAWVPVCGFKKWWLIPFIPDSLAIDEINIWESFLKILDRLLFEWINPTATDLSLYEENLWQEELKLVVRDVDSILIVHDYLAPIGGAEKYILFLKKELTALGKTVRFAWYQWSLPRWKRIIFSLLSPFTFWHKAWIRNIINEVNPDTVWMHSVSRYIWPWWLSAIIESGKPTLMTHHDLGLITARPSRTTDEWQISHGFVYHEFIGNTKSPVEYLARAMKYLILKWYWKNLEKIKLHLVPSDFMKSHLHDFWAKEVETFPHCLIR